jgi:hypothetical protein
VARHERDIQASGKAALSLEELLDLLGEGKADAERERQHAIACYLSGSDGWHEAVRRLGGAFAADPAGLRDRKAD